MHFKWSAAANDYGDRGRELAGVTDYEVARAAYQAAVRRWPNAKITLRNRARIIEQSWRD